MIPSTINPDLYACLPPDKKEEYKALFPGYPAHMPAEWVLWDEEFLIIPGQDDGYLVMKVEDVKRVLNVIDSYGDDSIVTVDTPILSIDLPDNALGIVKEALDTINKEDEERPQIIRQFDGTLARERLSKMLKCDGLY
jgi:hypothetical protein